MFITQVPKSIFWKERFYHFNSFLASRGAPLTGGEVPFLEFQNFPGKVWVSETVKEMLLLQIFRGDQYIGDVPIIIDVRRILLDQKVFAQIAI